jgi:hypothetical protein
MQYKENDVCRWSYKDTTGKFEPYWCKSKIAVFKGDCWRDTFWSSSADNAVLPENEVEIEYLGNLDDYKSCNRYDFDYYADKDCLNLSHSNNSGQYYIRKDAAKSVDKIRVTLLRELCKAEEKKQSAEWDIQRITEKLKNVTPDAWI